MVKGWTVVPAHESCDHYANDGTRCLRCGAVRLSKPYPMSLDVMRPIDHGKRALKELRDRGTRQQHGLAPNTPLTRGMKRDIDTALRAIDRLMKADEANRRAHRW